MNYEASNLGSQRYINQVQLMSFKPFKVLTFDVVGTLIDFETGVLDAFRRIGGSAAEGLSDDQIFQPFLHARAVHYGRNFDVMADVYRFVASELSLPRGDADAREFQLSLLGWPAFVDSAEALARLRRHFRLVATTNADSVTLAAYCHTLGYPFDETVCYDDTGCAKPDPRFFAFSLGRQTARGFRQSEILHVAQSQYHDIGVAKAEGYTTCWIERRMGLAGYGATPAPAVRTVPNHHFSSLRELADAVEAELG